MFRRCFSSSDHQMHKYAFKTETKKLLDLVTNSLYSDKQVFLRELVSNAADAITKARAMLFASSSATPLSEMAIRVRTFKDANKLVVQDDGIGMTKDELIECLGTIAKSDSANFASSDIIGKFGVGFYSAFTIAKSVAVYSRKRGSEVGHLWRLEDNGNSFTVNECPLEHEGTKVELELKEGEGRFLEAEFVKGLISKYSALIHCPIYVNDELVKQNTLPLWLRDKREVVEADYHQFYKDTFKDLESPFAYLNFSSDAPISLRSILFLPTSNPEVLGMEKLQPAVSLYSRRVLVSSSPSLLPDYLRFVRGMVECDDLPMNVSREMIQDDGNRLLEKLRLFLTKRVIKWLQELCKSDKDKYTAFATRFGMHLREGVCSESNANVAQDLVSLIRFKWSENEHFIGLDEYKEFVKNKDSIVYLEGDRETLLHSPQYEALKSKHPECPVLFVQEAVDEYMFNKIVQFKSMNFKTVDQFLSEQDDQPVESTEAIEFIKSVLGSRIGKLSIAPTSMSHPMYIADAASGIERLMKLYKRTSEQQGTDSKYSMDTTLMPRHIYVNPEHPLIKAAVLRKDLPVSEEIIEQLYGNALLSAGIIDDPQKSFLPGLNKLIAQLLLVNNNGNEGIMENKH